MGLEFKVYGFRVGGLGFGAFRPEELTTKVSRLGYASETTPCDAKSIESVSKELDHPIITRMVETNFLPQWHPKQQVGIFLNFDVADPYHKKHPKLPLKNPP